jgi:hypothetical protein
LAAADVSDCAPADKYQEATRACMFARADDKGFH